MQYSEGLFHVEGEFSYYSETNTKLCISQVNELGWTVSMQRIITEHH